MWNDLISKQSLDFIYRSHFLAGMLQIGHVAFPQPSFAVELYKELQDRCSPFAILFQIYINHKCIIYKQYSWNLLMLGIF